MRAWLNQLAAVTAMNLRNLPARTGASLVAVVGIGGVVAVLVSLLSMGEGFRAALELSGRDDVALVLRGGSADELSSAFTRDQVSVIAAAPGIVTDERGAVASPEFFTIVDLALSEDAPTGTFNVSTGIGHSISDVFGEVAAYLGIEAPDVPVVPAGADDVPAVVLDPAETGRAFGWQAQVGFAETIRRQLEWYDRHGVTDVFSHLAVPK